MAYVLPSQRPIDPSRRPAEKRSSAALAKDPERARAVLTLAAVKARERSLARGQPCDVTADGLVAMYEAQGGKCALTGIPFSLFRYGRLYRNPYYPSVDRIDTAYGYVAGNYRLVTLMANTARGEYGDDVFYAMCEAAVRHKGGLPKRGRGRPKPLP